MGTIEENLHTKSVIDKVMKEGHESAMRMLLEKVISLETNCIAQRCAGATAKSGSPMMQGASWGGVIISIGYLILKQHGMVP